MKLWCKIIIGYSFLLTIYLLSPTIVELIAEIRWFIVKKFPVQKREEFLLEQIMKIEMAEFNITSRRRVNSLYERIIKSDSSNSNSLIAYGTSCIMLALHEKDSLRSQFLSRQSVWAANRLLAVNPYNANNLIAAAKLYTYNGIYHAMYYDTADAIYSRIEILTKLDSLEIPKNISIFDRNVWIKELRETIVDLKFYNRMVQRAKYRKYFLE
ncbi:MAG: hypothetical protein ABIL20_06475 [candidate division WOR-3 bacterium]